MDMSISQTPERGFTLIGVVVALLLLTTVTISLSHLLATRNRAVETGRQTLVAANLAREGLELVRIKRDDNWLAGDGRSWVAGLCDTGSTAFTLDTAMVRAGSPVGPQGSAALWIGDNGEFTHQEPVNRTTSAFSRLLSLDCTSAQNDPAFIIVTSTVHWTDVGGQHSVELREKLFNWQPV